MITTFFSIIIPTFNSGNTLRTALDSVINQEFKNWEIVIIDGLSADDTIQIITEYTGRDSRIRFISEEDKGIYDAMNKGIVMATSEWLYFLGSDDSLCSKDVLLTVAENIKIGSCDFFYGNVFMPGNIKYAGIFDEEKLLKQNISHQAIFYKRNIFEKVGNYNIRFRLHADWDFNIRCFNLTEIKTQYADIMIARFGEGGISSGHDLLFLRETIVPLRMQRLNNKLDTMKNIRLYDEWWRLIRNAKIRSLQELQFFSLQSKIPPVLKKIVMFQQLIPQSLLRTGVVSKFLMLIHFLFSGNKRSS